MSEIFEAHSPDIASSSFSSSIRLCACSVLLRAEHADGVQPLLHQRGPATDGQLGRAQAEGVTAIQILLSVVAIPLVCLAAVFDERRRANEALSWPGKMANSISSLIWVWRKCRLGGGHNDLFA